VSMFDLPPKWLFKPSVQNFRNLFSTFDILLYLRNSVVATLSSTGISLFLGSLAGYGLARGRIARKENIAFWMISTRMTPLVGVMLPLYLIFRSIRLIGTLQSLVVCYTAFNLPLAIWLMRCFFEEVPKDVEEAAMVDGCNKLQVFVKIALPLVLPGLLATGVLCFIFSWNDYALAVVFTSGKTQTLAVACARLMTEYGIVWGQVMTMGVFLVLPVIALGLAARRYLVEGLTFGALK